MNKWDELNALYINKSLKIFPIKANSKFPAINAWQNDCSSDYMQILYWYENNKNGNWGLPATPNNLFIIDLDVHDENKNGIDNFAKLQMDIGLPPVSETLTQKTPSGGLHIIYKSDDELRNIANGSNVFKDYPGIDFRTDGYIVVEPSTINNKHYYFMNNFEPMEMPKKLKEFILNNSEKKNKEKTSYEKPKEVCVGNRDISLFEYINNLYFKTRLDYDEILILAKHFNEEILEEPFSERDVEYKVKMAFKKYRIPYIRVVIPED